MINRENLAFTLERVHGIEPPTDEEWGSLSAVLAGTSDRLYLGSRAAGSLPYLVGSSLPGRVIAFYGKSQLVEDAQASLEARGLDVLRMEERFDDASRDSMVRQLAAGNGRVLFLPLSLISDLSLEIIIEAGTDRGFNLVVVHDLLLNDEENAELDQYLAIVKAVFADHPQAHVVKAVTQPVGRLDEAFLVDVKTRVEAGLKASTLTEEERDAFNEPIPREELIVVDETQDGRDSDDLDFDMELPDLDALEGFTGDGADDDLLADLDLALGEDDLDLPGLDDEPLLGVEGDAIDLSDLLGEGDDEEDFSMDISDVPDLDPLDQMLQAPPPEPEAEDLFSVGAMDAGDLDELGDLDDLLGIGTDEADDDESDSVDLTREASAHGAVDDLDLSDFLGEEESPIHAASDLQEIEGILDDPVEDGGGLDLGDLLDDSTSSSDPDVDSGFDLSDILGDDDPTGSETPVNLELDDLLSEPHSLDDDFELEGMNLDSESVDDSAEALFLEVDEGDGGLDLGDLLAEDTGFKSTEVEDVGADDEEFSLDDILGDGSAHDVSEDLDSLDADSLDADSLDAIDVDGTDEMDLGDLLDDEPLLEPSLDEGFSDEFGAESADTGLDLEDLLSDELDLPAVGGESIELDDLHVAGGPDEDNFAVLEADDLDLGDLLMEESDSGAALELDDEDEESASLDLGDILGDEASNDSFPEEPLDDLADLGLKEDPSPFGVSLADSLDGDEDGSFELGDLLMEEDAAGEPDLGIPLEDESEAHLDLGDLLVEEDSLEDLDLGSSSGENAETEDLGFPEEDESEIHLDLGDLFVGEEASEELDLGFPLEEEASEELDLGFPLEEEASEDLDLESGLEDSMSASEMLLGDEEPVDALAQTGSQTDGLSTGQLLGGLVGDDLGIANPRDEFESLDLEARAPEPPDEQTLSLEASAGILALEEEVLDSEIEAALEGMEEIVLAHDDLATREDTEFPEDSGVTFLTPAEKVRGSDSTGGQASPHARPVNAIPIARAMASFEYETSMITPGVSYPSDPGLEIALEVVSQAVDGTIVMEMSSDSVENLAGLVGGEVDVLRVAWQGVHQDRIDPRAEWIRHASRLTAAPPLPSPVKSRFPTRSHESKPVLNLETVHSGMKTIADSLGALQDLIPHSATGLKARSFVDPAAVEQGKTGRQGTSTSGSRAVGRSGGSSLPDPDEILLSRQRERLKISSDSEQDRSLAEDVKPLDARKVPNPDPIPEPSSHRESSKAPVKRKKTKLLVSDEGLVEIEIDDEYDAPVAVLEAQELDDAIGEALTRIGETESNGAGEGQAPLETESNKEFSRLDEEDDVSPDSEPVSYPDDDEDDDSVLGQLDPISEIGVELDSALDEVLQIHLSQDVESESRSDGNNIRTRKSEPQSAGVKFLEEPEGDVTRAVHSAHSSVADVLKGVLDGMEDIQLEPAPEASTRKSAGSRPGDNVQKAPPAVAAEFPGSQVDALRISRPSAIPEGRERVVGVPLDDSQPKREIREVFDLPLEGHVFLHELQGGLAEGLRYLKERWEDPDSTVDRFYTLLPSIEETFPDDPRIPFANGVLAHLAGRRVDGLSALQRALDRYLQVKDTEGQQLCLEHIHSHFPEDIGIAERLAHLYEAIDLKGRAALVYQKLGESCVARGQERQGIGYFEKSLDLDGSRRDAALELIRGYRFMKDENKALDTAQRVLQSLPEDPFMKIMKAISLDRLGRSRAARTLVEGVAQDPKAQVHTDSLRRLFLEASERDLLQVFSGFESSMDSLSDGFLSDGSTSEGSSVHSLEDIQTDSAPGSRPVVGHLPGWDPSKVVSEGTTPETQARNVPRETRSPALSARAPESPPREEFPVDGRGRDAENMDMNGTLFDRIRRQVPRMSSNLKSLQSMEADVQDAHKRGILKDRAVARLLRSFQELGDALRPDAPDESHAVYRKGLEYIGWFEDQISRSLWRDDLDQRLRD